MEFDSTSIVGPTYTVWNYNDRIFKIINFKNTVKRLTVYDKDPSEWKHTGVKLSNSLSRTRNLLLAKALCNEWDYFCSFTLDKSKFDRYDLPKYRKSFSQWIRDQRKKGYQIKYLLVPEMHKDGAWHMHGFLAGNPDLIAADDYALDHPLPRRLLGKDYYIWPAYGEKFGFGSLGKLKHPVASAFYISKYITKDSERLVSELGANLFYPSQGLNMPSKQADVYGPSRELDSYLTKDYEFCRIGMTHVDDRCDWTFSLDLADPDSWEDLRPFMSPLFDDRKDFMYDMEQLNFGI